MLVTNVIIGAFIGAIIWPVLEKARDDAAFRAVIGNILGGIIGGAISWAKTGIYVAAVMGAAIGAKVKVPDPDADLGFMILTAVLNTVRGAAVGAVIVLGISAPAFVIVGAGIGALLGLAAHFAVSFVVNGYFNAVIAPELYMGAVALGVVIIFGLISVERYGD